MSHAHSSKSFREFYLHGYNNNAFVSATTSLPILFDSSYESLVYLYIAR